MEKRQTHQIRFTPGTGSEERRVCTAAINGVTCNLPASHPIHTDIRKVETRGIVRPMKVG